MSRLFAYMGNDPARVACALHPARKALVVPAGTNVDSWGIGFYQGEVLLQRRPKAPTDGIDFYDVARELRTDAIIGHARTGTYGKPKNENTHPFRFRSWMFAHHGSIPAFEQHNAALTALVPDFLARNIRGQTDSELMFHLFLSLLHGTNKLDEGRVSTAMVRDALRTTIERVIGVVGADAWAGAECALAVTNGRILVGTRHGGPVNLHKVQSITDCAVCREHAPQQFGREKRIDHEHLRSILLVADAPSESTRGANWSEVENDHFVAVNHDLHVELTPIH